MIDRIATVGAGAVGCLLVARLGQAGFGVRLVDVDPARKALIDREGLHPKHLAL